MESNASTQNTEEGLWTAPQVARFLRVSKAQVYTWARDGVIPAVKLGPAIVRFEPDAIRAWAKQRATNPSAIGGRAS